MKMNKYQVLTTKNYDLFEMHPLNRPIHKNDPVEASMRRVGFMPSSPIQCIKNGNGKLKIIRGHHRFDIAKRLRIPVCYIIDDSNTNIFELEGSSTSAWNALDFASARARGGDLNMMQLMDFKKKHGLTLGSAASLLGGESAGSNNKIKDIKSGTFKVCTKSTHAKDVVAIVDLLVSRGVDFAKTTSFVAALSRVLRIPEIDYSLLIHRMSLKYHLLAKRGTVKEYLTEIEEIYNHGAKGNRMPVAFRADEVAHQRTACKKK